MTSQVPLLFAKRLQRYELFPTWPNVSSFFLLADANKKTGGCFEATSSFSPEFV
jgi:hypothetical protein